MSQFSRKFRWTCSFVFAFTAFTLASPLSGLRGTVFDPSGTAIAKAKVELFENGVPVASAATDAKGQYVLQSGRAYQRLDLNTSYRAARNVAVEGNFQNLLCEHFGEAFGYPSLPFTFRMGVKLTLGGESWLGK